MQIYANKVKKNCFNKRNAKNYYKNYYTINDYKNKLLYFIEKRSN